MFAEFDRLDALMSVWRAGSDVLRINAAAGERAVPVSADVREVLRTARQVSEWTGGKFDVTFGALADIWKFDHDQDNTIPDADGHPRAAAAHRLPADRDRRSRPARCSSGARACASISAASARATRSIARSRILRRAGLRDFMIQAGGDLYVGGLKDGRPWRLGIHDPRGPAAAASRRST